MSVADQTRYSLKDANFVDQMRSSTLDLVQDEGSAVRAGKASQLKWDRKSKKFGNKNEVGADNKKMIRSESGALLPASYRSGRYDELKSPSAILGSRRNLEKVSGLSQGIACSRIMPTKFQRKAKNSRVPRRRK
jgi:ATP-dependent RNA helicase DDX54/DBP10